MDADCLKKLSLKIFVSQFQEDPILEWKHLLLDDAFKDIIIGSLQFLHKEGSVIIYAFVIMPNHMHMIWQIQDGYIQDKIQQRFLKFTGQQMKFKMIDEKNKMLNEFFGRSQRQNLSNMGA